MNEKQTASTAILELINWTDNDAATTEFERGVIWGLKIAQHIASVVEEQEETT